MRCKACDTLLSDWESIKKDPQGRYLDLCSSCEGPSHKAVLEAIDDAYNASEKGFNNRVSTKK